MKTSNWTEKLESGILKLCPSFLKKAANRVVNALPEKKANWIRNNKFLSICIAYTIRGLFFRPTMYPIYAAIAAYLGYNGWK